jgi:hypothetical protein
MSINKEQILKPLFQGVWEYGFVEDESENFIQVIMSQSRDRVIVIKFDNQELKKSSHKRDAAFLNLLFESQQPEIIDFRYPIKENYRGIIPPRIPEEKIPSFRY